MPPRPMDDLARRVTALESQPHPFCPSPALAARVLAMEEWQRRTNGSVEDLRGELAGGRLERYEQIEKTRIDLTAKIDRLTSQIINAVKWLVGTIIAVGGLAVAIIKLVGG